LRHRTPLRLPRVAELYTTAGAVRLQARVAQDCGAWTVGNRPTRLDSDGAIRVVGDGAGREDRQGLWPPKRVEVCYNDNPITQRRVVPRRAL
jgi:hypothetical protein